MTPIQQATTQELIVELLGRFEHAVLAAMRPSKDGRNLYVLRHRGNSATCHGLCGMVGRLVLDDFYDAADGDVSDELLMDEDEK